MRANPFDEILDTIENKDMREFAEELIKDIPDYFWHVPASSTGKYHPAYALGEGGLVRHTIALCKLLNFTFEIDCMGSSWTSREKDMMRIAGMMHDTRKSGSQEEYEKSKYTKFEHPLLAASAVKEHCGCGIIPDTEIETIAKAIESHMGQFNTSDRSKITLPLPSNKYQKIIHWADYLASRKDIEIRFEKTIPTAAEYRFTFGKHNGETLESVINDDPQYIEWLKTTELRFPLDKLLA